MNKKKVLILKYREFILTKMGKTFQFSEMREEDNEYPIMLFSKRDEKKGLSSHYPSKCDIT